MKKMINKIIDSIFEEIGFVKIQDDKFAVEYNRYNSKFNYTQCLRLIHKKSGRHIMQSYDLELMDEKKIGNTCVGLTSYEMKLCVLKMWCKGWNSKKKVQYENTRMHSL